MRSNNLKASSDGFRTDIRSWRHHSDAAFHGRLGSHRLADTQLENRDSRLRQSRQALSRLTAAATVVLLAACTTVDEPSYVGDVATGREVARDLCSSCHSIEAVGASPNAGAPPLRYVLSNYTPDRLVKDLEQSVAISHRRMPTFYFGEHHAADLVAYLKIMQQPSPPK
jgi:mono/diheme cytochrome c family protein